MFSSKYEMREFAKMVAKELAAVLANKQEPDKYLTLKEAAKFLNMSESTLYKRQDIPYKKVGKRRMYSNNTLVRVYNQ